MRFSFDWMTWKVGWTNAGQRLNQLFARRYRLPMIVGCSNGRNLVSVCTLFMFHLDRCTQSNYNWQLRTRTLGPASSLGPFGVGIQESVLLSVPCSPFNLSAQRLGRDHCVRPLLRERALVGAREQQETFCRLCTGIDDGSSQWNQNLFVNAVINSPFAS